MEIPLCLVSDLRVRRHDPEKGQKSRKTRFASFEEGYRPFREMLPGRAWAHSIEKTSMGIPPCGQKSLASTHFEIWVLEAEKISEKSHFGTPGRKTPPVRATLYIGSRLLHQSKEGTEAYNFLCYDFFLRCTPFEMQRPEPYRVRTNHVPPPANHPSGKPLRFVRRCM